jgi:hypothetical protein
MWFSPKLTYLLIRGIHKPQDGIVFETLKTWWCLKCKRWFEMINHPCGRQVAYFGSSCGWHFRGLTWWSENMMRRAQSMPSSWSGASAAWKVLRGHFLGAGSELETKKKEHWPLVSWIIVLWCFIPGGALALRKRFIGLYLYERTSPIISYYSIARSMGCIHLKE